MVGLNAARLERRLSRGTKSATEGRCPDIQIVDIAKARSQAWGWRWRSVDARRCFTKMAKE